jgi:RimJ/RimL family protein N-acetyltransferase
MSVAVRDARPGDVEAFLDLREAVAGERIWIATEAPIDRERDRARFLELVAEAGAGGGVSLVAEDEGGRFVGHCAVVGTAIGHLGMMVASDLRGRGVGGALLGTAIERARAIGVHKISLEHWPWNRAGRALYLRHGFVDEGYLRRQYRRRDGSLWDSVLMGLVLDRDSPGHPEHADRPPM